MEGFAVVAPGVQGVELGCARGVEAQVLSAADALDRSGGFVLVVERDAGGDVAVPAGEVDAELVAVVSAGVAAMVVSDDGAFLEHLVAFVVEYGLVEHAADGDEGVGTGATVRALVGDGA